MSNIKKRLNSETAQIELNKNVIHKVNLESKERLLPYGDVNYKLHVDKQFNKERQESGKYRFFSEICPVVTNVLFNVNGSTLYGNSGWAVFNEPQFTDDPYDNDDTGLPQLSFTQSYKANLKEINGWMGYFDPDVRSDKSCTFFDMEPKRERFSFSIPINPIDSNWRIRISYPISTDKTHDLVVGGLKIVRDEAVTVANRPMVAFTTVVKHNLNMNDNVKLTGLNGTLDGDYQVIRTGLDDGTLKENVFVIDIDAASVINPSGRVKKVVNGQESEYYFRKFKMVDVVHDCFSSKLSQTIYEDDTNQLIFNDDFDVSGLEDHLGRPISELYISVLKNTDSGFFSEVKSGIECPILSEIASDTSIPDINRMFFGGPRPSLDTPLNGFVDEQYGDVVEYNKYRVKEVILNEVFHRFNTSDRDNPAGGLGSSPRYEGYYYKPHNRNEVRYYSSYVEQGDTSVAGIPSYAEDLGDGRFLWRDFIDIGTPNGVNNVADYPFQNGAHYIYSNINFYLRRQDPFGFYGLLYTASEPLDISGNGYLDVFKLNKADDVC